MTHGRADGHWDCGPAVVVSRPADYPEPGPGPLTRWRLRTPAGRAVGVLSFDAAGAAWWPAAIEDADAQAHAAEVLAFLRGNRAAGVALADAVAAIEAAYAGDIEVG